MKVLLLHGDFNTGRIDDDPDQSNDVKKALEEKGHSVVTGMIKDRLTEVEVLIKEHKPDVIFNLVETFNGSDKNCYLIPGHIGGLGIPYTGCSETAIMMTGNKVIAKKIMLGSDIPTPEYIFADDASGDNMANVRYIVKSTSEQASFGIDSNSVVYGADAAKKLIEAKTKEHGGVWFAERFINGREINVSIMGTRDNPSVLPLAEILFNDYPEDKPEIVDYKAKWAVDSYEYVNTPAKFVDMEKEPAITSKLKEITLKCWDVFGLTGYARVDFRVEKDGTPWVLEINCNPCIGLETGFSLAAKEEGLTYGETLQNLIKMAQIEHAN